jgi:ATP-binding cassette subfamily B protein/subfamily B ATP-binding cassette protein MsbA
MHPTDHDEQEIGKVFDLTLISRLFTFMRPYVKYMGMAAVFLVVAAGVEILYPYLTKHAIDEYIVKNGKKVVHADSIGGFYRLDDTTMFAPQNILQQIEGRILTQWEQEGRLSSERYYYRKVAAKDTVIESLVARYPQYIEQYPALILVQYGDLHSLEAKDTFLLRGDDISGVIRLVVLFVALLILGAAANYTQLYLSQYAGQLFMHALRSKVFRKLQSLHLAFFDKNPVGRLVTRATNDVEAINEAFTQVFTHLLRDILLLVGIIIIMLTINVRLALISFAVIPVLLIVTFYFRVRARTIYREVRTKLAKLNARFQENLSGIRVIKIFGRESSSREQFDGVNKEYMTANLKHVLLISFFRPFIEIISSVGIGLVLYFGGASVITGKVSFGVLVAFITYVEMFFRPIRELTESYTLLQSAMASSERIFLLLDEPVAISSGKTGKKLRRVHGEIDFKKVWFKYDKEWVLKDISFHVGAGEHIAFVGPTGSGKTSIISLLSRLYDIQKGTIMLDGMDIKRIDIPSLRRHIGVVPQDVFLFAGDIRSNIRLNSMLSDEEVEKIASYIHADRFIDRFPRKFDQDVAERGITFSAGERQLLSFARALAFEPKILVLDEATANIDAETEKTIQEGIEKLLHGRTAIIIAHRLSTIKHVDRIYVIHNGRIVEEGDHVSLLRDRGLYYNLYRLQTMQHPGG